ncbi:MAG: hypothetical protein KKH04_17010, partial [Proteobacteria bacterium]|nr:hypothetical protein [Pseudomonadota bacterium]
SAPAIKRLQRTVIHASKLARPPAADPQPRSVALRAPERRVARSASPDLSDRALIRAAEQNRSSRWAAFLQPTSLRRRHYESKEW